MSATWPSVVRADYDPDKAVRTGRVVALADMRLVLCRKPFHIYFAEVTRANTAYGDMFSFSLFLPDYALGRSLKVTIEARTDGGNGGAWRLQDSPTADVSADVTIPGSASYADSGPATLAIPTTYAKDTARTIIIQGKAPTAETLRLRNLDLVAAYFTD